MANYWMHNGFLQVEGEKMAKSTGNFVTISDLLRTATFGGHDWPGSSLRFAMLSAHYRQPIDWTLRGLETAWNILDDFLRAAAHTEIAVPSTGVLSALGDDLNTPAAIAELHGVRRRVRQSGEGQAALELGQNLNFLGFDRRNFFNWIDRESARVIADVGNINELIHARSDARKAKNFAEADRIRDELAAMGVVLKDSKDGTTWEIAR
jgi:cysteinyl-tRNA synthetase